MRRTVSFKLTIPELASRQLKDYLQGTPGTYFGENHPPLALEEAYLLQAEVAKLRSAAGHSVAGYKIGCVGPKIRQAFGMSGPIRGILYSSELHASGSAASASRHTCLAVEGEMALRIGAQGEIVGAFPVIELHNYVFGAKVRSLSELIANNGLHAGVILPQQTHMSVRSLKTRSRKLEVRINNRLVDMGLLWSMPGGPEEALAWLKNHLAQHNLGLQAGHLILSGTPLGLHHVSAGDHIRVIVNGCGTVEVTVVE
jgi:2-keto-4-pentenoate hydratase